MKADMEALKEQMITMMEAMMSMKNIMEVNVVVIAATSIVAEVDPTPPFGLNQINHPTSDRVVQGSKELGGTSGPHYVQIQNRHAFSPYGLPPNYAPPNGKSETTLVSLPSSRDYFSLTSIIQL